MNQTRLAEDIVCISAKEGWGIESLFERIEENFSAGCREMHYCIPYTDSRALAMLHERAEVTAVDYDEVGTLVTAVIGADFPVESYEKYRRTED